MKTIIVAWILLFSNLFHSYSQTTVGLVEYQNTNAEGYVLFAPVSSEKTYLINKCGEKVHEWSSSYRPGASVHLAEDGSLYRAGAINFAFLTVGGSGGIIERFDWESQLIWSYVISDNNNCQHHDFTIMPNGNILTLVWERLSKSEAALKGLDTANFSPGYILNEKIIEIEPSGISGGTIVWEWRLWDHLVQDFDPSKPGFGTVADHPEKININYPYNPQLSPSWIHLNSIDYNVELDQIMVSSHGLSELLIIDHSTTTLEASGSAGGNSGKGGDIIYRWGNPVIYNRGTEADQRFFHAHHTTWIPQGFPDEGKILVFNNGLNRPDGLYSTIDIIDPPLLDSAGLYLINSTAPYLPDTAFWQYKADVPQDFYSAYLSGVYPLSNGGFIATTGMDGSAVEIDANKDLAWKYINPVNTSGIIEQGTNPSNNPVFRYQYYPLTYPGLEGRDLSSLGEIELNPSDTSFCEKLSIYPVNATDVSELSIYPNPADEYLVINLDNGKKIVTYIEFYDLSGQILFSKPISSFSNSIIIKTSNYSNGIYFLRTSGVETNNIKKIIVNHR